jgi:hypothetical protein
MRDPTYYWPIFLVNSLIIIEPYALVTKAYSFLWRIKRGESKKDKITTILKDRANIKNCVFVVFCNKKLVYKY